MRIYSKNYLLSTHGSKITLLLLFFKITTEHYFKGLIIDYLYSDLILVYSRMNVFELEKIVPLNAILPDTMDLLLTRRSVKTRDMVYPAPDKAELKLILQAAIRVPDHGKLSPWRFIVLEGADRDKLGHLITEGMKHEGNVTDRIAEKMSGYATQGPLLIVAVFSPKESAKIPLFEQKLSMGASCQNLLIAAHASGFVGQWLTGWAASSPTVKSGLGLEQHEEISGFIFIGSQSRPPSERPRPELETVVTWGL